MKAFEHNAKTNKLKRQMKIYKKILKIMSTIDSKLDFHYPLLVIIPSRFSHLNVKFLQFFKTFMLCASLIRAP